MYLLANFLYFVSDSWPLCWLVSFYALRLELFVVGLLMFLSALVRLQHYA